MANMISTFDGAIEIGGVSGPLGGPGDKEVFSTIRAVPDVIMVGSATVTAERYNAPSTSVSARAARLANGAWPVPRLAVVSARLSFDLELPMFGRPDQRPLVITTDVADATRLADVEERADIVTAGHEGVDLADALVQLGGLGARVVLCEGGPSLNGQLLAEDLIDEMCVSVAPMAAVGDARRIAHGPQLDQPIDFDLMQVLTEDHYLFLRYVRTARND
ncbi:MAG: dihydrofolate reductase family protein [Actinomycetota bacterium]|nr:dihydrofolate reductase family protein [Actinomycetota bacterium]